MICGRASGVVRFLALLAVGVFAGASPLRAGGIPEFSERRRIRIDGPGFRAPRWPSPAVADWNGDGVADLTLASFGGPLRIYYRNEDGTFRDPVNVQANKRGLATGDDGYCVADWNGDGLCDLLVGRGREIALYINTGTASAHAFDDVKTPEGRLKQGDKLRVCGDTLKLETPISGIAFADWDGDGLPDLIVGEKNGKVWFYRNSGTPGAPALDSPEVLSSVGSGRLGDGHFACPAVADIDGDGTPDIVVSPYSLGVRGYLSRFEGGKRELKPLRDRLGMVGPRMRICLADWDGDGRPDLLMGSESGELYVAYNRTVMPAEAGGGSAEAAVEFTEPRRIAGREFYFRHSLSISFADLNNDGLPDMIAGSYMRELHFYLREPGDRPFSRPVMPIGNSTRFGSLMGLSFLKEGLTHTQPYPCDWDGDGVTDIVFGSRSGVVLLLRNFGTRRRHDFDMRLQKAFNLLVLHIDERGSASPVMLDVDGDGQLDLILGNQAGELLFLRNTGQIYWPRFANPEPLVCGGEPLKVKGPAAPFMVDLDGDGSPDLVVGDGSGELRLFTGLDAVGLEFADAGRILADGEPVRVRAGTRPWVMDWNGDGVPDLVIVAPGDYPECLLGE